MYCMSWIIMGIMLTLRVTNIGTLNGHMIFLRGICITNIHLIILLSCLKHHFSITLQILIIGVSCGGDCGMFLIKYVEYFMHDH